MERVMINVFKKKVGEGEIIIPPDKSFNEVFYEWAENGVSRRVTDDDEPSWKKVKFSHEDSSSDEDIYNSSPRNGSDNPSLTDSEADPTAEKEIYRTDEIHQSLEKLVSVKKVGAYVRSLPPSQRVEAAKRATKLAKQLRIDMEEYLEKEESA